MNGKLSGRSHSKLLQLKYFRSFSRLAFFFGKNLSWEGSSSVVDGYLWGGACNIDDYSALQKAVMPSGARW